MCGQLGDKAKAIISSNIYMCLATVDKRPWAAPVFYAYDENFTLYFVSAVESNHAQHILANEQVAVAIYDSTVLPDKADGVQIEGIASTVGKDELSLVLDIYYERRFPDESERRKHDLSLNRFLGTSLHRFFKVVPRHVYILDPNSQEVDRRVEVYLAQ